VSVFNLAKTAEGKEDQYLLHWTWSKINLIFLLHFFFSRNVLMEDMVFNISMMTQRIFLVKRVTFSPHSRKNTPYIWLEDQFQNEKEINYTTHVWFMVLMVAWLLHTERYFYYYYFFFFIYFVENNFSSEHS